MVCNKSQDSFEPIKYILQNISANINMFPNQLKTPNINKRYTCY